MIILPTLRRPDNLKRFVKAYESTKAALPVYVIFDAADAFRYNEIQTPPHWRRISVPKGTCIGVIFNLVFKAFPKEQFYGIMADDVLPETMGWDWVLRDACKPNRIAWGFDGGNDETLIRHPFIGGDLARRLGFLAAPGIKHWFVDNVWRDIASALNCGAYLPQVRMIHHHYSTGKARMDRTYEEQPSHVADADAYARFMENSFPKLIKRLSK